MNDTTVLVLIFAAGILGGVALYGRRCEMRIARAARLVESTPAPADVMAPSAPEESEETAMDTTGSADA